MKKKNLIAVLFAAATFVAGCGNATENTLAENVENIQVSIETIQTESVDIENPYNESTLDISEEQTYREQGNLYLLENVHHNPENNVDVGAFEQNGNSYTLVKSVNIYSTDAALTGYTKEDFQIHVIVSDDEWSYCDFGASSNNYLVKTEELLDAISDRDKEMLIAASATPTPAPVQTAESANPETSVAEIPKVETPKVESTPAVSEPVVDIPVVATPVEEQPVVVESDKYTPEEVIAIYRSVMESNGITWDPSIKEFASWGSGYLYLGKGWIEENAYSNVEAFQFGGLTLYYLEIAGSDENYVYITEWNSTN